MILNPEQDFDGGKESRESLSHLQDETQTEWPESEKWEVMGVSVPQVSRGTQAEPLVQMEREAQRWVRQLQAQTGESRQGRGEGGRKTLWVGPRVVGEGVWGRVGRLRAARPSPRV